MLRDQQKYNSHYWVTASQTGNTSKQQERNGVFCAVRAEIFVGAVMELLD
jgi:hypothetical protein